jgi:hypothetical protein
MSTCDQIEFAIAPPFIRRAIALGVVLAFLSPVVWLAWKVGPERFIEAPAGWLICGMCLLPAGLFSCLAFPPRSLMARLQARHDGISFIPGRWVRRYFAQPVIEANIPDKATEVLLRQKGLPNGYAVVVCSADGHEREVYAGPSLTIHCAEEIRMISEGIAAVTGLPVRAVRRCRLADGTVQECPWTEPVRNGTIRFALTLAYAALPFVAGTLVAYLFPATTTVLAVGLALIVVQIALPHFKSQTAAQSATRAITSVVISGSAYSLAYVLTAYLLGHL